MTFSHRKNDRIAAAMFGALCITAIIACALAFWPMLRGAFTSPRDILIANPDAAVRDARALIQNRVEHPEKYDLLTNPESLPQSLHIPHLRYAKVHQDHVDLVVARNPDWSVGARIWSVQHRPHRDRTTRYPGVHFFRYTHELPESPLNIP